MKILIVAPHPDDECIGCGGSACLHVQNGDRVVAAFLSSGENGLKELAARAAWRVREKEAERAGAILGLSALHFLRLPDGAVSSCTSKASQALALIVEREMPDLVYCPHEQEWHPDHKIALPIVRAALAKVPGLTPRIWVYEVWDPMAVFHEVRNITAVMARKRRALREHRSQLQDLNYVRAAAGLNMFRGGLWGRCRYAEVFQPVDHG